MLLSFKGEHQGRQGAWAAGGHPLKRNAQTSQLWVLPVETCRQRARRPHRTTTTPKDNLGNECPRYLGLRQASRLILFRNQYIPNFPRKGDRPRPGRSSNQRTVQPTPAARSLSFVDQHPPTLSVSARPTSPVIARPALWLPRSHRHVDTLHPRPDAADCCCCLRDPEPGMTEAPSSCLWTPSSPSRRRGSRHWCCPSVASSETASPPLSTASTPSMSSICATSAPTGVLTGVCSLLWCCVPSPLPLTARRERRHVLPPGLPRRRHVLRPNHP